MDTARTRLETPIGALFLEEEHGAVTKITVEPLGGPFSETPLLRRAKKELAEYFAGTRHRFTFPVAPKGTPFQKAVWAALRDIPYGETRTYGEIAAAVGRPKAARAVGAANHVNPLLIVTPCHRVVGANGSLTGFAAGLDRKALLLALESPALEPARHPSGA